MDLVNASYKVSCWKSVDEFCAVKNLIFDSNSSIEDKKKALNILRIWKIRRGKDTALGVLCTEILLNILVKDSSSEIKDRSVLSTLYASALTKFINYATSFKLGKSTMYASANQLGIDSFLIDLRHSFAHGRQTYNLDVYRHSHIICMKWIKEYYWDREVNNIKDADIKDIRYDANLEEKLDEIFTFYDLLAELILKHFKTFEQLESSNEKSTDRWPLVKQFMKEKKLKNFRHAFMYFTDDLAAIIESKEMRLNSKTFFHVMLNKCELFMKASEMTRDSLFDRKKDYTSDDEEAEITPLKRPKKRKYHSIVYLYQNLIWHIAKNDYLKQFLDMLLQLYMNKGETPIRRKTSRFWIKIILKSYEYYQKYYEFTKENIIDQKKITKEVKNIYSYQLDVDLQNVLIFVGTQMLPTTLKFSQESVLHLLEAMNENDDDLEFCMNFMPLIYPPLSIDQIESMKNLIDIKIGITRNTGRSKGDKIFTVEDLQGESTDAIDERDEIWKLADKEIAWSSLPLGHEFKV